MRWIYLFFVAVAQEREVEGDLFLCDIGQGLGFRPGSFDGAIRYHRHSLSFHFMWFCSISALQWLCNADKKEHSVPKRLFKFFSTLYACLVGLVYYFHVQAKNRSFNRQEVQRQFYSFIQRTQHRWLVYQYVTTCVDVVILMVTRWSWSHSRPWRQASLVDWSSTTPTVQRLKSQ